MLIVISFLCLTVGLTLGWLGAERYIAYMTLQKHDFENLFEKNPHPEIFDEDGNINREEYMTIEFEPGYVPEDFDPEDIKEQ
tara:strand:- start:1809 stop:2054 length:246 start_codon:yes stop_codon:yes gene_type:complete